MPRRRTHADAGIIVPVLIYIIIGPKVIGPTFWISSFLFFLGNIFPDVLEPARYFTHRQLFHSQKLLKILFISVIIVTIIWGISWLIFKIHFFLFIDSFLVGYVIHLLLDSRSKMGLPKYGDSGRDRF